MKNLFIAAGDITWGSSRLRCYWPAKYMPDTNVIVNNWKMPPLDYDNYIFQKFASPEILAILKKQNKRIYFDVCDPSWWWQPDEVREILPYINRVVSCTEQLADDFMDWSGIKPHVIPDRIEPSHYHAKRNHADVSPIRFIWYGVSVNRISIFAALANLERLVANGYKIELTIMDNHPEEPFYITNMFPIHHTKWSLAQEVEIIASHDIALLGEYPGAWGRVKSNNRELTAWACGLPATRGDDYNELIELMRLDERVLQSHYAQKLTELHHISLSAKNWMWLLNEK